MSISPSLPIAPSARVTRAYSHFPSFETINRLPLTLPFPPAVSLFLFPLQFNPTGSFMYLNSSPISEIPSDQTLVPPLPHPTPQMVLIEVTGDDPHCWVCGQFSVLTWPTSLPSACHRLADAWRSWSSSCLLLLLCLFRVFALTSHAGAPRAQPQPLYSQFYSAVWWSHPASWC